MSFKNLCTISSSYEFQAHQQRSQRRCCFSQNALLWFEVLPDAHRFVAGAPRCSAMERDLSPGQQAACNSPSEGTRFRQSRQSCPEHPGVSDGIQGWCWCGSWNLFVLRLRGVSQLHSKDLQLVKYSWKMLADWVGGFLAVLEARLVHLEVTTVLLDTAVGGSFGTCHSHLGEGHILATVAHNLEIFGLRWWLVAN